MLSVVLGTSVIPAEAQWGPAAAISAAITGRDCRYTTQCGGYGGYRQPYPNRGYYDRSYYDPYYDPYRVGDGRDLFGRKLPPLEIDGCLHTECAGLKGTYHAEAGLLHFRPYDSTHTPFNMNHKNCLVIHSAQAAAQPATQNVSQPISYAEPASQSESKVVDPLANITWPTVNKTSFRAVVTDPNISTNNVILVQAGGSINLPSPSGAQPYVVVLLAPGRGSIDQIQGEIRPSCDFQGWDIVARVDGVGMPACQ